MPVPVSWQLLCCTHSRSCLKRFPRHVLFGRHARSLHDLKSLPGRSIPSYAQTSKSQSLPSLRWPCPPRNLLILQKADSAPASEALTQFARHVSATYPSISFICESDVARRLETSINAPVASLEGCTTEHLGQKCDLIVTFGGDGTILRASALFSHAAAVPPMLSFSMGTLGFLGEWKFESFKKAFREVYMSGAPHQRASAPALTDGTHLRRAFDENDETLDPTPSGWDRVGAQHLGSSRGSRVLLRQRLKLGIRPSASASLKSHSFKQHAMNEVLLHRGAAPHLIHIAVLVNGRMLTEAVGDGILVSTPTGSTAYALSAGGSILHPLVPALMITPICPRSLSFRPLVLPAAVEVVLRVSKTTRIPEVELSVDGARQSAGLGPEDELCVTGEEVSQDGDSWHGGVPCIMPGGQEGGDEGWMGGLNGLLKFNYPFGEEE